MTRRYGGLGIGSAISRGLIEVFGGQLSQQSRPGLGSRFCIRVRFPLHGPEQMPASQRVTRRPRRLPEARTFCRYLASSGLPLRVSLLIQPRRPLLACADYAC